MSNYTFVEKVKLWLFKKFTCPGRGANFYKLASFGTRVQIWVARNFIPGWNNLSSQIACYEFKCLQDRLPESANVSFGCPGLEDHSKVDPCPPIVMYRVVSKFRVKKKVICHAMLRNWIAHDLYGVVTQTEAVGAVGAELLRIAPT